MKKITIFLLRMIYANHSQKSTDGPLVGSLGKNPTVIEADAHCQIRGLEACTTTITARLCMINIVFANCEPITAYGEKTDQEKEGQKCKKIMFNGKINNFQSYYNAHDK